MLLLRVSRGSLPFTCIYISAREGECRSGRIDESLVRNASKLLLRIRTRHEYAVNMSVGSKKPQD